MPDKILRSIEPEFKPRNSDETLPDRFWKKVERAGEDDCWNWTAAKRGGYGRIGTSGGLNDAHRVSYRIHHGPIPDKMEVMHSCDNPSCVNPKHLSLGTHAQNMADKSAKGRGHIPVPARGEAKKGAVLTDDIVRSIRADSRSTRKIAADYGINGAHVSMIKRRKIWAHVPETPETP